MVFFGECGVDKFSSSSAVDECYNGSHPYLFLTSSIPFVWLYLHCSLIPHCSIAWPTHASILRYLTHLWCHSWLSFNSSFTLHCLYFPLYYVLAPQGPWYINPRYIVCIPYLDLGNIPPFTFEPWSLNHRYPSHSLTWSDYSLVGIDPRLWLEPLDDIQRLNLGKGTPP